MTDSGGGDCPGCGTVGGAESGGNGGPGLALADSILGTASCFF
jgi:hypothetical protein